MSKKVSVAILGSTGYVGLELVKILSKHPNVKIVFLGSENNPETSIEKYGKLIFDKKNVVGLNIVSSDESQSSDIKENIQDIEEKPKKKSSFFS